MSTNNGHGHSGAGGPGFWARLAVTLVLVPLLLVALKPVLMKFVKSRADGYAGTGRYGDAIRVYEKWLVFDAKNPAAWSDAAALYRSAGRHDDALRAYEEALTLDPQNAKTHFEAGMFHVWAREWKAAVPHFERARGLSGDGERLLNPARYRSALTMLERCYKELGDAEKAAATHAEMASRFPGASR